MTAGSYLTWHAGRVTIGVYWRRDFRRDDDITREELEEQYLAALDGAVRRAMEGHGKVGLLLSGGVDSAALLRAMRRVEASRIRTFSVHIGDPAVNDWAGSQRLAGMYGTDHCSIDALDSACLDILPGDDLALRVRRAGLPSDVLAVQAGRCRWNRHPDRRAWQRYRVGMRSSHVAGRPPKLLRPYSTERRLLERAPSSAFRGGAEASRNPSAFREDSLA